MSIIFSSSVFPPGYKIVPLRVLRMLLFHQKLAHKGSMGGVETKCFFSHNFLRVLISGHHSVLPFTLVTGQPEWLLPMLPKEEEDGACPVMSRGTIWSPSLWSSYVMILDDFVPVSILTCKERKTKKKANTWISQQDHQASMSTAWGELSMTSSGHRMTSG